MTQEPVSRDWTPYQDGTSGHQGDASEDAEPGRRAFIEIVRAELEAAGTRGLTYRDVCDIFATHHGTASSALSNLHRTGGAVRLQERRNRCSVYVTPENSAGRPTGPYRGRDAGVVRVDTNDNALVERIANVLWDHPGGDWPEWVHLGSNIKRLYRDEARAVLAALREGSSDE
jgi:hypothetical protein